MIKAFTVYRTQGKQFETFKAAVGHRENMIDEFIGKLPGFQEMPYKARIKFVQGVIDGRKALMELLNYEDEEPSSEG